MLAYSVFAAATPSPTPTMNVDPDTVTPGPIGFIAIVVVVVLVVFLIWDMQRRIRRTRYRDEVREELDAEQLAQKQGRAAEYESDVDDTNLDADDDSDPTDRR